MNRLELDPVAREGLWKSGAPAIAGYLRDLPSLSVPPSPGPPPAAGGALHPGAAADGRPRRCPRRRLRPAARRLDPRPFRLRGGAARDPKPGREVWLSTLRGRWLVHF